MQNSYCKVILWAVAIAAVALLAAALLIKPTFDDLTTLSSPNNDPDFLHYLLPMGSTWRPLDSVMGYINIIDYRLFPTLSHIEIWATHLGSTMMVWLICKQLRMELLPRTIATAFFFFSPCTLATTLSCDGTNQSSCHLMGMLAVWAYLRYDDSRRYILWMLFVVVASMWKDNGIAWAVVPPVIAWAFNRIGRRTLLRHFALGLALAAVYGAVRLSLPNDNPINMEYEDQMTSLPTRLLAIGKWLGYTWTATDFLAVFNPPTRNLLWAAVSLVLSIPFFLLLLFRREAWRKKQAAGLVAAIIITESPNLIIAMSLMNAYASLGMAALLVAWLTQQYVNGKGNTAWLKRSFAVYILVAALVGCHHWYWAWQTSLPGMAMAEQAVEKTNGRVDKVYCITIRDNAPKYSSFYIPAYEAFAWGRTVWQITGYKWPTTLNDTVLEDTPKAVGLARRLARKKLRQGYGCVWIAYRQNVEVIRK